MLVSAFVKIVDDVTVQVFITNSVSLNSWEQIIDQTLEKWHIFENELRHIHISECSHEDNILWEGGVFLLELTCHDKYGLQSSQLEIVVILLRKLILG